MGIATRKIIEARLRKQPNYMQMNDSARRRILVSKLRAEQERISQTRPSQFAAYKIVKTLIPSQSPGVPIKTASVLYDRHNAVTGRAIEKEFAKRGVRTQSLGFVGDEADLKTNRPGSDAIKRMSRSEAVVFLTKGNKDQFDNNADIVVNEVERRNEQKKGSKLALIYGIDNMKATRVLAATMRKDVLMRRFTTKTFAAVKGARQLSVTTKNGTNLTFSLSPQVKWLMDDGAITKKLWGNFVSGEVYTTPLRVDGNIVLDMFVTGVGNVQKSPIHARISGGRVVPQSVRCANEALRQKFLKIIQTDKNAGRIVGELGLGTNVTVKQLTGGILIDEKIPGLHVAFGDGYGEYTGIKGRDSLEHNDALLKNPTITVNGRKIMADGKSLLK